MPEHIEIIGEERVRRHYAGVAERMANPTLGFGAIIREFEHEERSIFEEYGGKYVKTGALEHSLTEDAAEGAVRLLTPSGFDFGSAIPYARFQGTAGVGNWSPPSAIMKLTPGMVAASEKTLMEFIMHGGRA